MAVTTVVATATADAAASLDANCMKGMLLFLFGSLRPAPGSPGPCDCK
jgi:hypothetical protein